MNYSLIKKTKKINYVIFIFLSNKIHLNFVILYNFVNDLYNFVTYLIDLND